MEQLPQAWFVNLGIKINNLPRVAFSIFGFDIYWYSIIITIGIIAGLMYAIREAKRTGQNPETYLDFIFVAFFSAIVGARLYYVIFSWDEFKNNLIDILNTRNGGLAIYGGVIGSVIATYFFAKVKKLNFWQILDTAAPGLVLGQAIGRWGNFLNREAFGGYTDSLFALRYLASEVGNMPQSVYDNMVNISGTNYIQVHPTFLYESAWNILVFIFLNIMKKHKKIDGEIILLYFVGYGIGRFIIEGMRTDQLILFNTGIPASQLLSAVLAVFSIIFIIYRRKKQPVQEVK